MKYEIELSDNFKKEAKKLIKKYASLKDEMVLLAENISENPTLGTLLGNEVYKVRLAIASKGKGKSEGARIITFVKTNEFKVIFPSIYSKGERNDISDQEIVSLLKNFL